MTLAPLGFDFPVMSALSIRPPWQVEQDEYLPELEEELRHRRPFYARMVARGTMAAQEAERHLALWEAVIADVAAAPGAGSGASRACRPFLWHEKVRELRRELQLRRNAWPRKIGSPTLPISAAQAALRMERLEAVHWRYWVKLDHCDEFGGPRCAEQTQRIRAYMWRVEDWERRAADAGDPGARPEFSTAATEAWFAAHPDCRAGAQLAEAVYLEAARALGFVGPERASLCSPARTEEVA